MPARGFLSHLDLNVAAPAASIAFYDVLLVLLGFERTELSQPDRASWRRVDPAGAQFEIEVRPSRHPGGPRHVREDPGIDHLAFHASSTADVDEIHDRLVETGYEVDEPPRFYDCSPGYYAVGFDDPDGIRLEVVYDPTTNP